MPHCPRPSAAGVPRIAKIVLQRPDLASSGSKKSASRPSPTAVADIARASTPTANVAEAHMQGHALPPAKEKGVPRAAASAGTWCHEPTPLHERPLLRPSIKPQSLR
eukprot:4946244-Amphidinium_carterae.2